MDPGRVEGKQKLRREMGHCNVFTYAIYYLLETFSRVCMQIEVHVTNRNRAHYGLKVVSHHKCPYVHHYYLLLYIFLIVMVEVGNRYSQLTAMTHIWIYTQVQANNHRCTHMPQNSGKATEAEIRMSGWHKSVKVCFKLCSPWLKYPAYHN